MLADIKPSGEPSSTSNLGQAAPGFPETAARTVAAPGQSSDGEPSEFRYCAAAPLESEPGSILTPGPMVELRATRFK